MPAIKTLRFAPFFILALAAAGCVHLNPGGSSAPRPETVSGTLTYRQRIALPAGSIIHAALVEIRGKAAESVVLSDQSFPASGQVPIPFAITFDPKVIDPARHYAVRARITDADGRVFWATPRPVPVLTQGHPNQAEVMVAPAGSYQIAPPATFFFECDGLEFTARHDPKGIYLFLPGRTLLLPETPSASGAKYSDGKAVFWSKGEEALLEVDGTTYKACKNNRKRAVWEDAKLNGVDFRAVGNEPGWYLEIYDKGTPEKIDSCRRLWASLLYLPERPARNPAIAPPHPLRRANRRPSTGSDAGAGPLPRQHERRYNGNQGHTEAEQPNPSGLRQAPALKRICGFKDLCRLNQGLGHLGYISWNIFIQFSVVYLHLIVRISVTHDYNYPISNSIVDMLIFSMIFAYNI